MEPRRWRTSRGGLSTCYPNGMYLYTPSPDIHRVTYVSRCTFVFVSDGPFDIFWDGPEQGVIVPRG